MRPAADAPAGAAAAAAIAIPAARATSRSRRTSMSELLFSPSGHPNRTGSGASRAEISDVVHRRAGVAVLALDDVADRRVGEDGPGGGRRLGEDRLGAASEGAVEELDDLEHRDGGGVAGEGVAALDAALGARRGCGLWSLAVGSGASWTGGEVGPRLCVDQ